MLTGVSFQYNQPIDFSGKSAANPAARRPAGQLVGLARRRVAGRFHSRFACPMQTFPRTEVRYAFAS